MKQWFLIQITEVTAWVGLFIILGVFFAPWWVNIVFGVLLIAIDDKKATEWVQKQAPWIAKKVNELDGQP